MKAFPSLILNFALRTSNFGLSLLLLLLVACSPAEKDKPAADSPIVTAPDPSPAFDPEEMRSGIEKLEKLHSECIIHGSTDSLKALYADEARLCPDNSTFIIGPEAIAEYWKQYKGSAQITRNAVAIDGNAGLLFETGIETVDIGYQHPVKFTGPVLNHKYVVIWKKQVDNSWAIVSEMWNQIE